MNRKLHFWIFFIFAGICIAAEAVDAEILKDLDFFSSIDVIQDDLVMDEAGVDVVDLSDESQEDIK